jgi:uncharacterized protein (DUF924 family)
MSAGDAPAPGEDWRSGVLNFWFGLSPDQWFRGPKELDEEVRERFLHLWEAKRQLPVESFLDDPRTALAGVILFDQFPRNMFRDHADQFSTDHLGLAIAKGAISRKFDDQLTPAERKFLYMPFQHSEKLDDQREALLLYAALDDPETFRFAQLHHDIIERFGRFPHRNTILGRGPRADEIAAGDVVPW